MPRSLEVKAPGFEPGIVCSNHTVAIGGKGEAI